MYGENLYFKQEKFLIKKENWLISYSSHTILDSCLTQVAIVTIRNDVTKEYVGA